MGIEKDENENIFLDDTVLRGIIDQSLAGIYLIQDGVLRYTNQEFANIFGYDSPTELINHISIFDLIAPEDRKVVAKNINFRAQGKIPEMRYSFTGIRKDGERIIVEVHGRRMELEGMPAVTGVILDITDRKRMEQSLRESEERFRTIHKASFGGIVIHDKGIILDCNQGLSEISGYSYDELIGTNGLKLIAPEWIEEVTRKMMSAAEEPYEVEGIRKDGTKYPLYLQSKLIPYKGRTVRVGEFRDITEQKLAKKENVTLQAQLVQSQKMEAIGSLAGGIAHDFNNILFPISGHAEILLTDLGEDSPLRHSINQIYSGAMRAKELVKQILTFSRQESAEVTIIKIQHIVKEALKLIRVGIPSTIEIKQNINNDCGPVKADPTQIHQIIMNLSTNASHAMRDTGGVLNVNLNEIEFDHTNSKMEPGKYVCLTISDSGVGIETDVVDKIFNPFFTTKKKGEGTGMGLSVVHGIVIGMGGDINVYSEPGKGTEFRVYFPAEEKKFDEKQLKNQMPVIGGNECILLVDDEVDVIELEKQALERLGYTVISRTSSVEAFEAFRFAPEKFDLVISDVAMPKLSGDKLASKILNLRPDIPIILCTGFSETVTPNRAKEMGVRGLLMKPIIINELTRTIRTVLDKKLR